MELEGAKIGDTLAIMRYVYGGNHDVTRATVVRVTATRVVVDGGQSFMKSTGRKVGDTAGWTPAFAKLWTAETDGLLREMEANMQLRAAQKRLRETQWDKFDAAAIAIMIAALDQITAPI